MSEQRYHYLKDGKPVGPISFVELQQLVAAKQIGPQDMVWPIGTPSWIPASQVAGLFAPAPAAAPPTPASPPPQPPAAATVPADQQPAQAVSSTGRDALTAAAMAGFESGFGGKPAPAASGTRSASPGAFLAYVFTSLPGAAGIAAIGVLFLCCGGCGIAFSLSNPSAPTKFAIADLEKSSKPPDSTWLEITDGHLFWPEMVRDITEFKKDQKVEKVTTNWYYVPIVSKEVLSNWEAEFAGAGVNSKFSYAKARVFLKISPAQMQKDFPEVAAANKGVKISEAKSPVKGTLGKFKSIPAHVMKGVTANAKDQDAERMIVLNYAEEVSSMWVGVCIAVFIWFIALLWFIPLGVVLIKRLRGSRSTNAAAPTAFSESKA